MFFDAGGNVDEWEGTARGLPELHGGNQLLSFPRRLDVVVGVEQIPQRLVDAERATDVTDLCPGADQQANSLLVRGIEMQ